MTKEDRTLAVTFIIATIVFAILAGIVSGMTRYALEHGIKPEPIIKTRATPMPAPAHPIIDTAYIQIIYTDTWGKIFIMKEEDL